MTTTAVKTHAGKSRAPATETVPGATWFGAMVATWSVFFTLLSVSPQTLDDAYDWLRGLSAAPEVLMWIVTLPWTLAYLAWESSWEHWVRVLVVVVLAGVHLMVSAPRGRPASES